MKYVATKPMYYKGDRLQVGEEFEGPDNLRGRKGNFVAKDEYIPKPQVPPGGPTTISQIARTQPASPVVSRAKEDLEGMDEPKKRGPKPKIAE